MDKSEIRPSKHYLVLLVIFFVYLNTVTALENIPFYGYGSRNNLAGLEDVDIATLIKFLAALSRSINRANELENSKRGSLDLGLSRGYSGSQQAKHMMGIAAAGLSGGPGKRRRRTQYPLPLFYDLDY